MKAYIRHIPFIVVLAIVSLVMTRGNDANTQKDRPKAGVWVELTPALPLPKATMLLDAKATRAGFEEYKDEVVLLNLWATWCTPCIKELPTLQALSEQYEGKGLKVITLSVDAMPFAQVEGFVKNKLKITLTSLAQDDSGEIQKYLSARGLPVTYLITQEGKITHRFIGATDWLSDEALEPVKAALTAQSVAK